MPKLFADVASMQPATPAYFKWLKGKGVQKLVVKVTESLDYVNPSVGDQFANGLHEFGEVALYHFLHNKPIREARYFVEHAKAMGAEKDTLMVVDVESPDVKSTKQNVTQNVNDWLDTVYDAGFHNLAVYASESWFNSVLSINYLHHGAKVWVAGYGRKPQVARMDAWQYTDSFGGRTQDMSYDYGMFGGKPVSNFYKSGNLFMAKHLLHLYHDKGLTSRRFPRFGKGTIFYSRGFVKSGSKYRIKTAMGYVTAHKDYVKKIK